MFNINTNNQPSQISPILANAVLLSYISTNIIKKQSLYPLNNIVISIPPYSSIKERSAILSACKIANLNVSKCLNESIALGLLYRKNHNDEFDEKTFKKILFIDIGASKTTVSLLLISFDSIQVISEHCERNLGVRDIDMLLAKFYQEKHLKNIDVFKNKRLFYKVMEAIEKQRKILSANSEAAIHLENITEDYDLDYVMKRNEFEKIVEPYLEQFRQLLIQFRLTTNYELDGQEIMELVGGGSRIPILLKTITEIFEGANFYKTLDANDCIAMGCALYAGLSNGVGNKIRVTPGNISEKLTNRVILRNSCGERIVFEKDSLFPNLNTIIFGLNEGREVDIFYLDEANKKQFLYKILFEIEGNNSNLNLTVSITLNVNLNGLVLIRKIYFLDNDQKEFENVKINYLYDYVLNDETMKTYEIELKKLKEKDMFFHEIYHLKNEFETYLYKQKADLLEKFQDYNKENEKEVIHKIIEASENWLYNHDEEEDSKELYENKMNSIKSELVPYFSKYQMFFMKKKEKQIEIHNLNELKDFTSKNNSVDSLTLFLAKQNIGDGGGLFGYFKEGFAKIKNLLTNDLEINETIILYLSNNNLTDASLKCLTQIFEKQRNVKNVEIYLHNLGENQENPNSFSLKGLGIFLRSLYVLKNAVFLKLSIDDINEQGLNDFGDALKGLKNLEMLYFVIKYSIEGRKMEAFKKKIAVLQKLKDIKLEYN